MQHILLLVGQLNYTWTNTESLLIYLIAGLAGVDKETAIVIFLTLNTTRARLDLVERLAKLAKTKPACRKDVLDVTANLSRQQKLRNKYNHCVYSFDETGKLSHTQLMRIVDTTRDVRYGKVEAVDDSEMARIRASIGEIAETNRAIWEIVRRYGFPH
ncbi:hypothetical protein NGM99_04810 [Mesorhizobium sp. RP14(2022)]|uniref:Uncharacterized protein n=1 Tax=Mesorhizobium liriopis TaxID=2953882 RepID=A0ABT1C2Q1_9HYPH|nr:hypothetical protein [Mesorhizobium liriopis]MCO6049107.1 hypothetical protein [Mesorhizobium liriopis]